MDADLLTTAEVAARFRVTPAAVTRWARLGYIPAIKLPGGRGRLRFRAVDVAAFLDGQAAS